MIRHSVILILKPELDPNQKLAFFDAVNTLKAIPGVQKFEILKQTSSKNKFEYGISMEFDNQEHYEIYSNHADHIAFIQDFWIKSVENFLEIDYVMFS